MSQFHTNLAIEAMNKIEEMPLGEKRNKLFVYLTGLIHRGAVVDGSRFSRISDTIDVVRMPDPNQPNRIIPTVAGHDITKSPFDRT